MPKTKEQFAQIRQASSEKILDAALRLFSRYGFHGTSMSKIAEEAGISAGLTYNYFESKNELLKAIMYSYINDIKSIVEQVRTIKDPKEQVVTYINLTFDYVHENPELYRLSLNVFMHPDLLQNFPDVLTNYQNELAAYRGTLVENLSKLGFEDAEHEAIYLFATVAGINSGRMLAGERYPFEKMREMLMERYFGV